MGMFDYVKFKANCWNCGTELENQDYEDEDYRCKKPLWQTKDSECELEILDSKNPDIQNLYTSCPKCGKWNEYEKQEIYKLKEPRT